MISYTCTDPEIFPGGFQGIFMLARGGPMPEMLADSLNSALFSIFIRA